MSKENGGPAFPAPEAARARFGIGNEDMFMGVTVRDYFAAKSLAAMMGSMRSGGWNVGVNGADNAGLAQASYAIADAMLAERAK